jgi:hypothetical protein
MLEVRPVALAAWTHPPQGDRVRKQRLPPCTYRPPPILSQPGLYPSDVAVARAFLVASSSADLRWKRTRRAHKLQVSAIRQFPELLAVVPALHEVNLPRSHGPKQYE